jgi:RNA polymerase sigma factor (TIGR02999 family)
MNEVTSLLNAAQSGDPQAAEQLFPLIYDDLRRLAARRLAREAPGQTLDPTSLIHEVYLRLVGSDQGAHWDSKGHFFAAAAEAMRRILVENARRKRCLKRGGGLERRELDEAMLMAPEPREDLLALDEALTQLAATDRAAASLVELRYFAGLSMPEAAQVLGIALRTAERLWTYARAWLHEYVKNSASGRDPS